MLLLTAKTIDPIVNRERDARYTSLQYSIKTSA
jgi:hypothetical protein